MSQPRIADAILANEQPNAISSGMTADTFFTLSPSSQTQNLIGGVLYISPKPSAEHEDLVAAVLAALRDHRKVAGGYIIDGRDCLLGDDTVVRPDLGYLVPERTGLAGLHIRGAPDLAIEVLSPGTARFDRSAKLPAYAQAGVREVWLVDPADRTVTVIRNADHPEPYLVVSFGEPVPSDVVDVGTANLEPST